VLINLSPPPRGREGENISLSALALNEGKASKDGLYPLMVFWILGFLVSPVMFLIFDLPFFFLFWEKKGEKRRKFFGDNGVTICLLEGDWGGRGTFVSASL
jgi:hypothetical protein